MTVCGLNLPVSRFVGLAAGLCMAVSTLALSTAPADARGWHARAHYAQVRHHARSVASSDPAFSAIVVDANTGREIWGVNENGLRHPASITKVMTLYLLFEQLEKGAMTLQTQIPISEHAAAQEPSKLGISAGDSLSVEDAIKAVVTRSANDVAVAIAEAVGHDEDNFAAMMTRKAHSLGMSRTIYRNASGLPNDEQITTAHDLTVLARATEEHFPRYFKYFSTHEFTYDGEVIGNHNHLLGRVDGVDGIKTGYTRASGFNLLTSVHKDGRSLVAVVMGGRSAGARDRTMEQLISDHLAEASTNGHTGPMVADNEPADADAAPIHATPARFVVAANAPTPPAHHVVEAAGEGDNNEDDDASPRPPAKLAPTAAARVVQAPARVVTQPVKAPEPPHVERVASVAPQMLGWSKGPDAVNAPAARPLAAAKAHEEAPKALAHEEEETRVSRTDAPRAGKDAWIIQIGASDDADKANELLIRARAQNKSTLASARPVTEKFKKGDAVFYRARFAGLDAATAEQACRSLKRSGFACFAQHD